MLLTLPSAFSLFIIAELLYGNPLFSTILATNDPFGLTIESVSDFSCEVTGTFEFELIQLSDSLRGRLFPDPEPINPLFELEEEPESLFFLCLLNISFESPVPTKVDDCSK